MDILVMLSRRSRWWQSRRRQKHLKWTFAPCDLPVATERLESTVAVQLLLGHAKLESTIRYLGIEVNDALELTEQTEV